jgi:hypothetical protein
MNKLSKIAVGAVVAGALVCTAESTASAAPVNAKSAFPITLQCDNGMTYYAVVNGGGSGNSNSGQTYNPAHSVTDNSVLQPVAFGESTFSLYVNGELIDQEVSPPAAKGGGNAGVPANAAAINCSYTFEQSSTDPTTGQVFTFEGSGTVTGFIPASPSAG